MLASVHNMGWWCEVPTVMHSVVRGLNVQLGHLEQKVRAMLDKDQQRSPALFHEKTHLERSGERVRDYDSVLVDEGWQVKGTY